MTSKIADLAGLIKPELPIAAGVCVLAGEIIALGHIPSLIEGVFGFLVGFLISGAAMASNDYFDLEVDRINAPQRPLPSGRVTEREVVILTAALAIIGLVAAAMLGPVPLLAAAAIWTVGIFYNWRGKEFGLGGNLMVAFSVSMTFVFGGLAVGAAAEPMVWTFGAMAFLFDLGEEIANGIMDAAGDAKRNARSLARIRGRDFALNASGACFAALIVLTIVPYAMGWESIIYLVMVAAVDASIVILHWRLRRARTVEDGKKMTRMLYLVMLAFIIFFLIGRAI